MEGVILSILLYHWYGTVMAENRSQITGGGDDRAAVGIAFLLIMESPNEISR